MLTWEELPALPNTQGFAGAFAGVCGGSLVVAGGTNFTQTTPDGKPEKTWYDSIYILPTPASSWQTGYRLPHPSAYGASIVAGNGLICVGGCDSEKNYADVYKLQWHDGEVRIKQMPPLPEPVSCAAAALVGNTIYVAGGQPGPNPLSEPSMHNFWALNLSDKQPQWRVLEPWPGVERFYAVGASDGKSFYMISGLRRIEGEGGKAALEYLQDAYRYDEPSDTDAGGWHRLADLPRPNGAAATPAPVVAGQILLLGNGADGSNLDLPVSKRPGFGNAVLAYDIIADRWQRIGTVHAGRAALTAVRWSDLLVLPSGEARPMVRSPQVQAARVMH